MSWYSERSQPREKNYCRLSVFIWHGCGSQWNHDNTNNNNNNIRFQQRRTCTALLCPAAGDPTKRTYLGMCVRIRIVSSAAEQNGWGHVVLCTVSLLISVARINTWNTADRHSCMMIFSDRVYNRDWRSRSFRFALISRPDRKPIARHTKCIKWIFRSFFPSSSSAECHSDITKKKTQSPSF